MKGIFIFLILLGLTNYTFCEVKKTYLLKITEGEKPDNKLVESEDLKLSEKFIAEFQIVEEKIGERDKWLKVIFSKGGEENKPYGKCKFGDNQPKVYNWDEWEIIKFDVYNPNKNPIKLDFIVREKKNPFSYKDRLDISFVVGPGKSTQKLYIQGATNNSGEPFDLKNIYEWFIALHEIGDEPIILYFGDIELTFE